MSDGQSAVADLSLDTLCKDCSYATATCMSWFDNPTALKTIVLRSETLRNKTLQASYVMPNVADPNRVDSLSVQRDARPPAFIIRITGRAKAAWEAKC